MFQLNQITRNLKLLKRSRRRKSFDTKLAATHLNEAVSEMGKVFGNIGENLGSLDDETKRIKTDCEVLLDAAVGKSINTDLLLRAAAVIEKPMKYIESRYESQESNCRLMSSCEKSATELLNRQSDMVTALEPLKFMLVFFKIEAAHLSEENKNTFRSVSDEIAHLHLLVDETFQQNIDKLIQARASIATAERKANQERVVQGEIIDAKRFEISNSIQTLTTQIEDNLRQDTDLQTVANNFENSIGHLVMSLQYEDIFRQRCESILKAFDEDPQNVDSEIWMLAQARQMQTAAKELRESAREVEDGLLSIATQAQDLYQTSTKMEQFEHITASADGMVQTLLESIDSVRDILEQSSKLSIESREAINPVKHLTENLSEVVFEVSIKIQFIALNAQVRSIQVGAGSGLEVLAANTAEISTELRDLGTETSKQIESLHASYNELINAIDSDFERGLEEQNSLKKESATIQKELHQLRDRAFESLNLVAKMSSNVQCFTSEDTEKLRGFASLANKIEDGAQSILDQVNLYSRSQKSRATIEKAVEEILSETRGAIHTRVPSNETEFGFDLEINKRMESRRKTAATLACDNIDLF